MSDDSREAQAVRAGETQVGLDRETLRKTFTDHIHYTRGRELETATARDRYVALALSVRDRLIDRWAATRRAYDRDDGKRVYYLSAEFLMGRALLGSWIACWCSNERPSTAAISKNRGGRPRAPSSAFTTGTRLCAAYKTRWDNACGQL